MNTWLEFLLFILFFFSGAFALGYYMEMVFLRKERKHIFFLTKCENIIYKLLNINNLEDMNWKGYAGSLLLFNGIGFLFLFVLQLIQGYLPLNPEQFPSVNPLLALNTAISFMTNTNWQSYAGETTMSYLTQMLGLTVQNFLSAATGNAVLLALIRGIANKSDGTIGNYWVDLTRTVLYLLLPLSILLAIILVSQGVIQNFEPYVKVQTLINESQILPMGPVASQVAIKQLGSNGGGFFAANSAHPFENPNSLSNFFENLALLIIPSASIWMYGFYIKSKKQVFVTFTVMAIFWAAGLAIAFFSEETNNPLLETAYSLEGKELRFGYKDSVLWAISTTATSSGSVNAMLASLSPLAGAVAMFNMMIGEIVFGGVGVGLCEMLIYVFFTLFLAGLMVGRTPEYQGKKIEKTEMRWVMLVILTNCFLVLIGPSITILYEPALDSLKNGGPHGLSEILYTFASNSGNNGSAFAGLNSDTFFFNTILSIVMFIGRFSVIIPCLAIAGSFSAKRKFLPSLGTFDTDGVLFGILLTFVILIIAALTFFPALCLGPIAEQLLMKQGRAF